MGERGYCESGVGSPKLPCLLSPLPGAAQRAAPLHPSMGLCSAAGCHSGAVRLRPYTAAERAGGPGLRGGPGWRWVRVQHSRSGTLGGRGMGSQLAQTAWRPSGEGTCGRELGAFEAVTRVVLQWCWGRGALAWLPARAGWKGAATRSETGSLQAAVSCAACARGTDCL